MPPKPELPTVTRWEVMTSLAVQVSVRVPMEAYRGGSGLNGSGKKAKTCPRVTCGRVTRAPLVCLSYISISIFNRNGLKFGMISL